jgi:hypothetical protein
MADDIRMFIYKIQLQMSDGVGEVMVIATLDKNKLPQLIDKNKHWFEKPNRKVNGWKFGGELNPFTLPLNKYEEEIAHCDVVDEVE